MAISTSKIPQITRKTGRKTDPKKTPPGKTSISNTVLDP
jgi:hypothetical protein